MTREEYAGILNQIANDPDKAQALAAQLVTQYDADTAAQAAAADAQKDAEKRIKDLQDTNTQLFRHAFLTKTGNADNVLNDNADERKITPEVVAQDFLNSYKDIKH